MNVPASDSTFALACPICGNGDLRELGAHRSDYRQQTYKLRGCPTCDVWHWTPLVHPEADYYENDNEAMYAEIHARDRDRNDPRFLHFLETVRDLRGKAVLDVGCSDGSFLSLALERGAATVKGIDLDARAVEIAVERGIPATVATAEAFVGDLRGPEFDVITMFDVLEHLVDPVAVLRRLRSALRPGGLIAVTVPNRDRWFGRHISSDQPPHHFIKFNQMGLRSTLEHAGFSVDRVEVFQWGYASTVALDLLRRAMMARIRGPQGTTTSRQSTPATRLRRRSKQRVAEAVFSALRPLSAQVERRAGRGFKLFALAREP